MKFWSVVSVSSALLFTNYSNAYEINDYGEVDLPIQGQIINVPKNHQTIQSAINAANSGDTILVAPGLYIESLSFNNKPISLLSSDGPSVTTIQSAGGTTILAGQGSKIYGFTITNGSSTYAGGMHVSGSGLEIKYNVFDNNRGFGAAIWGNHASALIEQNVFTNNRCDNQHLSGVISFVNTSQPRIVNNIFDSNPCRALNFTVPSSAAPFVINNTIVRNRTGLYVDRRVSSANQTYRNNLIYSNDIGVEMRFGNDSYNPVFENNLVYNNTANYLNMTDQTGVNGNISVDPQFVDFVNGDLHIKRTSPAVDAGTMTGAPLEDFDAEPRPFDGDGDGIANMDIGADEYSAKLSINIEGDLVQECNSIGGNSVGVDAVLSIDQAIVSEEWFVDGQSVSLSDTSSVFIGLGEHILTAEVMTETGDSYTAGITISVIDTTKPFVEAYFVDRRSGETITSIESENTQWVSPKYVVSDICDANPSTSAVGGFGVHSDQELKIQGNLDTVSIETDSLTLSVISSDQSGNTQSAEAVLHIQ